MYKTNNMNVLGCIGLFVVIGVLTILSLLLEAYVISQLWSWFVMDQFDVTALAYQNALGISLLVSYATWRSDLATKKPDKTQTAVEVVITAYAAAFIKHLLVLVFGYIIMALY